MLEYLKIANSPILWISVIPAVGVVLYQAAAFMRKATESGKEMGITDEQIRTAKKSAFLAALGPSLVILIGMVALLTSMGGPVSFMRLSFIGSVMYELPSADIAASTAGSTLGTDDMTAAAFANAVWIMTLCSLGWIIVSALFTDKMGTLRDRVAKGSEEVLAVIATAGGVATFTYQVANRVVPGPISDQAVACYVAFIIMFALNLINEKKKLAWISQFGITIAMISGMVAGSFLM
ncbi:MAG TPA: DUF5058 family protein [Tepidimicrobium sp.]|nr:DUF5058 family protein [Tepidimicrobium sp.]